MDVLPSFYDVQPVGDLERYDGLAFSNTALRVGEVRALVRPEHPRSRTKKFNEYDVFVTHRENGTVATKMYHNCILANPFGGVADKAVWTLRNDPSSDVKTDGVGSKVLLLCVNGEHSSAVILGGVRNSRDTDRGAEALGHHLEFVFNGTKFETHDDGSWTLTNLGKTKADGSADPNRNAGAGTTVKVEANGTFTVHTKDNKQSVIIDHVAGTTTITADSDLILKGANIHLGASADEHAVLGDTLKDILGELIDAMCTEQHPTNQGPSGPPLNAAKYRLIKSKLSRFLSNFTFVKKNP